MDLSFLELPRHRPGLEKLLEDHGVIRLQRHKVTWYLPQWFGMDKRIVPVERGIGNAE